jgi:transposase
VRKNTRYLGLDVHAATVGPTGYVLYWQLIKRGVHCEVRRVLIEAAHHYRHQPRLNARQRTLQRDLDPRVVEIAWKAQLRLSRRYTLVRCFAVSTREPSER